VPSCFPVIVSQRTSVNVYDPDIFNCFGHLASVISPRGLRRLCFSLGIQVLAPAVPRKSLCPTPSPYTPAAVRVFTLPTD
jgi:hypothetical protein